VCHQCVTHAKNKNKETEQNKNKETKRHSYMHTDRRTHKTKTKKQNKTKQKQNTISKTFGEQAHKRSRSQATSGLMEGTLPKSTLTYSKHFEKNKVLAGK
jgi:hypothetical protein